MKIVFWATPHRGLSFFISYRCVALSTSSVGFSGGSGRSSWPGGRVSGRWPGGADPLCGKRCWQNKSIFSLHMKPKKFTGLKHKYGSVGRTLGTSLDLVAQVFFRLAALGTHSLREIPRSVDRSGCSSIICKASVADSGVFLSRSETVFLEARHRTARPIRTCLAPVLRP